MRYLLAVFATVFILIAVIFWARSGPNDQPATGPTVVSLADYTDSSAKVVYEIRSELVAEEERQAIRITVDRNQRTIEILSGYNQQVVSKKTYANNTAAFEEFVYGLDRAGFTADREPRFDSEKGVCPEGNITVYTLLEDGREVSRLWSGSCNRKVGSLAGDRSTLRDLFEAQIPEYREFTEEVSL